MKLPLLSWWLGFLATKAYNNRVMSADNTPPDSPLTYGVAAVGLDAGGAIDDGRVGGRRVERLNGVEVKNAVLELVLRRALAPPASKTILEVDARFNSSGRGIR